MRSLILLTIIFSTNAFAAEGSEFFWQAGADKSYLSPTMHYETGDIDTKAGSSVDVNALVLSMAYEQGLSEQLSWGTIIGYTSGELESGGNSIDISGLSDLGFFLKGTSPITAGHLKYGVLLTLSPGDKEIESSGDQNMFSGQHTLTPMIGLEIPLETSKIGARLSYELHLTDKKVDDVGTTEKRSGNAELAIEGFIETDTANGAFGAKIEHAMNSDTKNEETGDKSDNPSTTTLAVYGFSNLNEGLQFVGEFGYLMMGSSDSIEDGSAIAFNLGLRLAL